MTLAELYEKWSGRRAGYAGIPAFVDAGSLIEAFLGDLKTVIDSDQERLATLADAAVFTGYSAEHLGRLVRNGSLPNHGRKRAPRVKLSECPTKIRGRVAGARSSRYDSVTDARFLVSSRR